MKHFVKEEVVPW